MQAPDSVRAAHLLAQRGRHVAAEEPHVDAGAVRLALAVPGSRADGQPGLEGGGRRGSAGAAGEAAQRASAPLLT